MLYFLLCENFGKYIKPRCLPMTKEQKEMIKLLEYANSKLKLSKNNNVTASLYFAALAKSDIELVSKAQLGFPVTYCPLEQ